MLLSRKWPAGFNESAIGAAIDGTVRPDVDIDTWPSGFDPDAVRFPTVVPIQLHEKLVVRENVASAAGGFTRVDLAF